MQSDNRILGNQLVVMSREDLDALVNEMAQNIVAAQTKNAQNDLETWMNVPEGERFITREEAAHILQFARHGHNLMGESPERAPIAGSA